MMKHWFRLHFIAVALTIAAISAPLHAVTWFVDASASSNGNGESWVTPFDNLQDALDEAQGGDEIWVANGVYKPTQQLNPNDERSASFDLLDGRALYGGFASGEENLSDRRPEVNITTLSGDIGVQEDPDDNCYHVVTGGNQGPETILSGFTIRDGNADATSGVNAEGGGVRFAPFYGAITRCRFTNNHAKARGGGIALLGGGTRILNSTFLQNTTDFRGGALYLDHNEADVANCVFANNSATVGGAITTWTSRGRIINCALADNTASGEGGGIWISGLVEETITNCIFWGNSDSSGTTEAAQIFLYAEPTPPVVTFSDIQGCDDFCVDPADGNIGEDPLFCDAYRLDEGSPCIDVGDNDSVAQEDVLGVDVDDDSDLDEPVADRDLNQRINDGSGAGAIVDMGAFERGPCPEAEISGDCIVGVPDLLIVLAQWGACPGPCPPYCEGDIIEDCEVNTVDLLMVLGQWDQVCGTPQGAGSEGFSGGDGWSGGDDSSGGEGLGLAEAMEVLGFDGVEDFVGWAYQAESYEVYATAQALVDLLGE